MRPTGWFSERTAWVGRLTPLRRFVRTETGGAAVLVAAVLAALVWANVGSSYQEAFDSARDAGDDGPEELFTSAWRAMELLEAATRRENRELAGIAFERIVAAMAFADTDSAPGVLARSRALLSEGSVADELYREAIERLGRTRLRPELARAHLL